MSSYWMCDVAQVPFLTLAYMSLKVDAVLLNFSKEIRLLSVKNETLSSFSFTLVGDMMDSRRKPPNLPRLGDQKR